MPLGDNLKRFNKLRAKQALFLETTFFKSIEIAFETSVSLISPKVDPKRRHAIISTNDILVFSCIHALFGLDKLLAVKPNTVKRVVFHI